MAANKWICLQLVLLSISSATWGQQLRSSATNTQQNFLQQQVVTKPRLQQVEDNSSNLRINTGIAQTNFPQTIESQHRFHTSQHKAIQGSKPIPLQDNFQDSLADRERAKISQLEAQKRQRQGFQSFNSQDPQLANFQTHTPQRSSPTPVRQQSLTAKHIQQQKPQGQVFPAAPLVQQQGLTISPGISQRTVQSQPSPTQQFQATPVQQRASQQAAVAPPVPTFQHSAPAQQQQVVKSPPPIPDRRVPLQQTSQHNITQDELFKHQAETAKYSFDSVVTDGIMDNSHVRQEVRDGLNVRGLYSYSDGFYKRTVHYEADQNGYRVVKEETELIGNGPQVDLAGTADVATNVGGVNSKYSITAADIPRLQRVEGDLL